MCTNDIYDQSTKTWHKKTSMSWVLWGGQWNFIHIFMNISFSIFGIELNSSDDKLFFFQGKGGVFADRSVGLASALIATTVVLFVVSSESPRSIRGPTFLFVLTISIICPTIFIIGSKKMRQSTISNVKQKISDAFDKTKMGFRKMFHRNRVGIEPNDEPGIDKCWIILVLSVSCISQC